MLINSCVHYSRRERDRSQQGFETSSKGQFTLITKTYFLTRFGYICPGFKMSAWDFCLTKHNVELNGISCVVLKAIKKKKKNTIYKYYTICPHHWTMELLSSYYFCGWSWVMGTLGLMQEHFNFLNNKSLLLVSMMFASTSFPSKMQQTLVTTAQT